MSYAADSRPIWSAVNLGRLIIPIFLGTSCRSTENFKSEHSGVDRAEYPHPRHSCALTSMKV